jgi:hypothetical protein
MPTVCRFALDVTDPGPISCQQSATRHADVATAWIQLG